MNNLLNKIPYLRLTCPIRIQMTKTLLQHVVSWGRELNTCLARARKGKLRFASFCAANDRHIPPTTSVKKCAPRMTLLKETSNIATTANDSLVLLPLDRIKNAPVALET